MRLPGLLAVALPVCLVAAPLGAEASSFNFDITFNGVNPTIDGTSDPIVGTSLIPGDTFQLDIHAESNDFWQVNSSFFPFLIATFAVQDAGQRFGNITTTLFLDGVQVAQEIALNVNQLNVHMGNQSFNFLAGTTFDQLVVDYSFVSTTAGFTTIQASPDILAFSPFFRNASITYVEGVDTVVPEPATLLLLGAGLAAIAARRRRTKRNAHG